MKSERAIKNAYRPISGGLRLRRTTRKRPGWELSPVLRSAVEAASGVLNTVFLCPAWPLPRPGPRPGPITPEPPCHPISKATSRTSRCSRQRSPARLRGSPDSLLVRALTPAARGWPRGRRGSRAVERLWGARWFRGPSAAKQSDLLEGKGRIQAGLWSAAKRAFGI